MIKNVVIVSGGVLTLLGVLGFIPAFLNDEGLLLGAFKVNALHNVIHLLTGAAAIAVGMHAESGVKTYFQFFGVAYSLIAVLGFIYMEESILGVVANNMADNVLHVVVAVAFLYLGFTAKEEGAASA